MSFQILVFNCDECSNEFNTSQELLEHEEHCLNQCRYCLTIFVKYGNMIHHQKTNRTCLNIQNKTVNCHDCNKEIKAIEMLNHQKECLSYYQRREKDLNAINDKLNRKLLKMKEKNNQLDKLLPISTDFFNKIRLDFEDKYIENGLDGIIEYLKLILKDRIIKEKIHDINVFKYKDEDDIVLNDKNMSALWNRICLYMKPIYKKVYDRSKRNISSHICDQMFYDGIHYTMNENANYVIERLTT